MAATKKAATNGKATANRIGDAMEKALATKDVTITAPNFQVAEFEIEGTAPYVQCKFSEKAKQEIQATQEAGSTSKKGKKKEAKVFKQCFEEAQHLAVEGWNGIPAPAFRNALISACKVVGFHMTKGKLALFIVADGVGKHDGVPLVKINGKPKMDISYVRLPNGVVDLRARPMWNKWSAKVRIQFDADMFSATDVANLLMRAGVQVGIGEGRPDSSKSNGMGWGTFKIKEGK